MQSEVGKLKITVQLKVGDQAASMSRTWELPGMDAGKRTLGQEGKLEEGVQQILEGVRSSVTPVVAAVYQFEEEKGGKNA